MRFSARSVAAFVDPVPVLSPENVVEGLELDRGEEGPSSMLNVGESRGLEVTEPESGAGVFGLRSASMKKFEDIAAATDGPPPGLVLPGLSGLVISVDMSGDVVRDELVIEQSIVVGKS